MPPRERLALLRLVVAAACAAAFLVPAAGKNAVAAEQNRAVLVVDTGEQVKRICVRFWEESISGAEMLRRAEVDAAMRPYAGKGVAVCSLCGVGCRTDDSCLTCDPDGRFWAYSRAPAGTSTFRLSPGGASNTEVRNGDVEGWRWSRGTSPGYISVEEVCDGAKPAAAGNTGNGPDAAIPEAQPPATTVAPAPAGPTTTVTRLTPSTGTGSNPPRLTPAAQDSSPASSALPSATAPPATVSPASSSGAGPAAGGTYPADDTQAVAARRPAPGERGGSPVELLAFAVVLAGLLGWAAWARRRRRIT